MLDLEYLVGEECDTIIDRARLLSEATDESNDKQTKGKLKSFIDKIGKFLKKLIGWLKQKLRNIVNRLKALTRKKNKDLDDDDMIEIPNWNDIDIDKVLDLVKKAVDAIKPILKDFMNNGKMIPLDALKAIQDELNDYINTNSENKITITIRVGDMIAWMERLKRDGERLNGTADLLWDLHDKIVQVERSVKHTLATLYLFDLSTVVMSLASSIRISASVSIGMNDVELFSAYMRSDMSSYRKNNPRQYEELDFEQFNFLGGT